MLKGVSLCSFAFFYLIFYLIKFLFQPVSGFVEQQKAVLAVLHDDRDLNVFIMLPVTFPTEIRQSLTFLEEIVSGWIDECCKPSILI